tara:strand:- start:119 stop:655 length:537 start_codon:yes stop_codon:yes gene_type:complete
MKIFLLALIFPTLVFADARVNDLQALMPGMIDFIESRGVNSYKGDTYPQIYIVNEQDVCTGAYGKPVDTCDIAGYYNDDTNEIYIRDEPTENMSEDRFMEVVLVHELVHFLQYFDGTWQEVECKQQLEMHAYEVQDAYVDLYGIDEQQKIDPLFAIISSMCPQHSPNMFNQQHLHGGD